MPKTGLLTRNLAVAGTLLVWFPILAPLFFGVLFLLRRGFFRIDYLMPAELFLVALAGGGLLLWAAIRARSRRGLIAGGLAAALVLLVGSQILAVVTGLASGETEPAGLPWALVVGALALYILALVVTGVGGALLIGDVFGHYDAPSPKGIPGV